MFADCWELLPQPHLNCQFGVLVLTVWYIFVLASVSIPTHLYFILAPDQKCIILGHDWGGALSWMLAAQSPQLVEKVIIMNSPHPGGMIKYMMGSWKQILMSW